MKKFWSREESKERFPLPISPLGWSLLEAPTQSTLNSLCDHLHLSPLQANDILKNIDHTVYARKGFFGPGLLKRVRFWHWLLLIAKLTWLFIISLVKWQKYRAIVFQEIVVPRAQILIRDWEEVRNDLIPRLRGVSAGEASRALTDGEFQALKTTMESHSVEFFYHDFSVFFFKNLFLQFLRAELSSEAEISVLSQGLPQNFSVRMAMERTSLSEGEWLAKYGHLTDNWDIFAPTLAESAGILSKLSPVNLQSRHLQSLQLREDLEQKLPPQLLSLVQVYQSLLMMDEDMRAYSSLQYPAIRKLFCRVAATAGWPFEDIFFLEIQEIELGLKQKDFSNLRSAAQKRKIDYFNALTKSPPDECVEVDGQIQWVQQAPLEMPKGLCVSPGVVKAPALVVHRFEDLQHFTNSCILVLRSATPTYAAFYSQCAGVISETGGLVSHGALVAREFQIPMISNVPGALEIVRTGDMIYLDASKGIFEVLNRGNHEGRQ